MRTDEKKAAKLYTPKKREKKPVKLSVDQYLKQANLNEGIGGLVRSMHGTKSWLLGSGTTLLTPSSKGK
jgi:hypothetical protein